ncbi:hypothetical protein [Streptomyces sp. NPDC101206]
MEGTIVVPHPAINWWASGMPHLCSDMHLIVLGFASSVGIESAE